MFSVPGLGSIPGQGELGSLLGEANTHARTHTTTVITDIKAIFV